MQGEDSSRPTYRHTHLQFLLQSLLQPLSSSFPTVMLTRRSQQLVSGIMSEGQILSLGFKRILDPITSPNAYMKYYDVVLVLTLSSEEDYQQIDKYSRQIHRVYLVNLGVSTSKGKQLLRSIEFGAADAVAGFKEENLDFTCYLENVFVLGTRVGARDREDAVKSKKYNTLRGISEEVAVDRLCSVLFSYDSFSSFQFYVPKNNLKLKTLIKATCEEKLKTLQKYQYKALGGSQGLGTVKTRVIILQRSEQVSPFMSSLYYGPLVEELGLGNNCRLVSCHSKMYNALYSLDYGAATDLVLKHAQEFLNNRKEQFQDNNILETKKMLEKAYNPDFSKEEINYHQTVLLEIKQYLEQNIGYITLQQSIANMITEHGQKIRGSQVLKLIHAWLDEEKDNLKKYHKYLGVVMQALLVHDYWWYQRNELLAGIDAEDRELVRQFADKCKQQKVKPLKQKQPKIDADGCEVRQQCFRHEPTLLRAFLSFEKQLQSQTPSSHELLPINQSEIKTKCRTRTVLYIHDNLGYNQLALLLSLRREGLEIVCRDVRNTRQWMQYQLYCQ